MPVRPRGGRARESWPHREARRHKLSRNRRLRTRPSMWPRTAAMATSRSAPRRSEMMGTELLLIRKRHVNKELRCEFGGALMLATQLGVGNKAMVCGDFKGRRPLPGHIERVRRHKPSRDRRLRTRPSLCSHIEAMSTSSQHGRRGTSLRVTLRAAFFATQVERCQIVAPASGCQTRALCVTHSPERFSPLFQRAVSEGRRRCTGFRP
jgi:hypothetical protein